MGGIETVKHRENNLYYEVLLNTWATFVYFFSQWLLTVLVTRFSGYEDAGTFTLAVSFSNIFGYISKFGMRSLQVGDIQRKYSDSQYFVSRIITSVACIVPFIVTLTFCQYRKDLHYCCIAMMVYKLLEGFDDVIMGSFQRLHRYREIAISYTAKAILTLGAFCGMLLVGYSLCEGIWSMVIVYSCVLILYDFRCLIMGTTWKVSFRGLLNLYRQCIPLVVTTILDAVLLYLPRNAVERFYGAGELGYYGTISVVVVVLSTLGGAVWGSILSQYSEFVIGNKWHELKMMTKKIALLLTGFGIVVLIFGNLLGPFFFAILFGHEILNHMDLLTPVLLNAILLLYNSYFNCIFIPLEKRNTLLITDVVAVLSCLLCTNTLTQVFGTLGASYSLTFGLFLRFLLLVAAAAVSIQKKVKNC